MKKIDNKSNKGTKTVKMSYAGRYDLKPSSHGMTSRAKKILKKRTKGELFISTNNVS